MSDGVYPCPCEYWNHPQKSCTCAPAVVTKYQKRISRPLLDRIDIHIEVPRVDYEKLSGDRLGESSEIIRQRVQAARDIQNKRFSSNGSSDIVCNVDMRVGEIRQFCKLQEEGQRLMGAAMTQLNLSARAYHRTQSVKLARTIADLAEALQYRPQLILIYGRRIAYGYKFRPAWNMPTKYGTQRFYLNIPIHVMPRSFSILGYWGLVRKQSISGSRRMKSPR